MFPGTKVDLNIRGFEIVFLLHKIQVDHFGPHIKRVLKDRVSSNPG